MTEPGELNKPLLQAADDALTAASPPPQPQPVEPGGAHAAHAPPAPQLLLGTGAPSTPPYA